MKKVFTVSDNIYSPLGFTSGENFMQLTKSISGVQTHDNKYLSPVPFNAALFDDSNRSYNNSVYTKFEQLLIASMSDALQDCGIEPGDKKTLLIISSTKGNISLLETEEDSPELPKRIALHTSANLVADYFHFVNKPLIVSNACISGLLAIITGMRMIQSGLYENVVIAGADTISKFVLSGFQSFKAISDRPCKPFDKDRDGINLGEGAATLILSSNKKYASGIEVAGGATGNDANHISGPSRTGEELCMVITKSLQDARIAANDVDFISAHGTATIYNDEMEANAFSLAGMNSVPVNSLKGYYGHTLGAAGLIESIVTLQSMKENLVIPTRGFLQSGVTQPINICDTLLHTTLDHSVKTASGFGGCNAAVVFSKS
jgi:3-oxoacyl-[acyl-carrier-protein] synthase-1